MNFPIAVSRISRNLSSAAHRNRLKALFCAFIVIAGVLLTSSAALAVSTIYTVNSNADTNTGSGTTGTLRYVIGQAADGDSIVFNNIIGTITLVNGPISISHSITITGPGAGFLTISGNNASQILDVGATATISGLTFANGSSASSGGAILDTGNLTLENCIFSNNTSGASNGGAIYNLGTLTVSGTSFNGNTTSAGGGAIANFGNSLTVVASTFSDNTSAAGGSILSNSGTAMIENSTFTGNSISGGGPGAALFNGAVMIVDNTTVVNNLSGGGIWNNGVATITLNNSIVSGNVDGDCLNCGTQSSNNLIGGTPNLGPLQLNGGITLTMMPLPGSPAIGAGSGCLQNFDERGFARPTTSACDLGAVETNYYTVTNLNDSGAGSLRQAMTDAIASTGSSGDIVFQSGLTGTITLASELPEINGNFINIEGPGANALSISGNGVVQVFDVSGSPSIVNLSGVTITKGRTQTLGVPGGLFNNGLLTIESSMFTLNGGDTGGAILNQGNLIVQNSTFLNNTSGSSGGGILNQRNLIAVNDTFNANYTNLNGGGLDNPGGTAVVENSTFSGNFLSTSSGVGGGIYDAGPLVVENNIISGNTNLGTNTPDDCTGCSGGTNLIGGTAKLGALAYNGLNATTQTMIPLPGSVAIQGGDATQVPWFATTDQRGFPRFTNGKLDLGAVQTNYTSANFVQQPTTTLVNAIISPAVTLNVLETNTNLTAPNNTDAVAGIPIALTFSGTGTLSGTLTQTTGSVATFNDLKVNAAGSGNELKTSVAVTGTQTLTATSSPFDVVLPTPTVSFNPALPASVTYGVAPLTLKATTVNSSGQPTGQTVTFQVDSGPATVSGNVLTITGAGSVVVEVDAAANGIYGAADAVSTINVNQASLTATAASMSRVYGTANPVFTGSLTGAVNGDTFVETFSTVALVSSNVGGYPIVPSVTGAKLADYALVTVPGTLTITQAASNMTLGTSATQVTPGTPVTLTATVTSATTGFPTGSVIFMSGSTQLGTAPLNAQGVATLIVTTLPVGTNTITANYSGDVNFTASQAQLNQNIVVGTPSITMTANPTGLTIHRGDTGVLTLTLTPTYGYTGKVLFNCSNLPQHSSCSFSPAWVVFSGSTPVEVTLTIATNIQVPMPSGGMAQIKPLHPLRGLPLLPAIFFWLPGTDFSLCGDGSDKPRKAKSKARRLLWMVVLLVAGASALVAVGCGANFKTPTGQQTVVVRANGSGGASQSVNVQVTVQ